MDRHEMGLAWKAMFGDRAQEVADRMAADEAAARQYTLDNPVPASIRYASQQALVAYGAASPASLQLFRSLRHTAPRAETPESPTN